MAYKLNILLMIFFVATTPIQAAENIRGVKTIEPKSFDRNEWMDSKKNRSYQWGRFLDKYELIGMPKARLIEHLGEPTWNKTTLIEDKSLVDYPSIPAAKAGTIATYFLSSSGCGSSAKSIQIRLNSKNRVVSWRVYGMHEPDKWLTKNSHSQTK